LKSIWKEGTTTTTLFINSFGRLKKLNLFPSRSIFLVVGDTFDVGFDINTIKKGFYIKIQAFFLCRNLPISFY